MANNYVQTSFLVELNKEQKEYARLVYDQLSEFDDENPEFKPNSLQEEILADPDFPNPGFMLYTEPDGIWIHEEEYAEVSTIANFLLHLIQKFDLPPIRFTWSETCSKPRPDEFGGGCCVVSKREIYWSNVWEEADRLMAKAKSEEPT